MTDKTIVNVQCNGNYKRYNYCYHSITLQLWKKNKVVQKNPCEKIKKIKIQKIKKKFYIRRSKKNFVIIIHLSCFFKILWNPVKFIFTYFSSLKKDTKLKQKKEIKEDEERGEGRKIVKRKKKNNRKKSRWDE